MKIIEPLNNVKDEKERIDLANEINKIDEYKTYILRNNSSNPEIRQFILDIINKYRNNAIVGDYYNSNSGDQIQVNDYHNLEIIERRISNYIIRKIILENSNM